MINKSKNTSINDDLAVWIKGAIKEFCQTSPDNNLNLNNLTVEVNE